MTEQKPSQSNVICTFPGKIGDLLWSLPTMNAIAHKHGCKIDVATSKYCQNALRFISEQEFVNAVFVPEGYVIQSYACGIQPWEMPVSGYEHVYHLGFREFPTCKLRDYIGQIAEIEPLDFIPNYPIFEIPKPYIVVANNSRDDTMIKIGKSIKKPKVVWLGEVSDFEGHGIHLCSADFWLSAGIMMEAEAVISSRSSNAVLAHLLGKSPITIVQAYENLPIFEIDGETPLDGNKPIDLLIKEVKETLNA